MNNSKIALIVVAIVLVAGGLFWLSRPSKDSCEYVGEIKYADVPVMGQLMKADESYDLYPNHYRCQNPKKGELAAYTLGQNPEVYVRVVAAAEGDVISVKRDPVTKAYNLLVNGLVYSSSDSPYWFGVPDVRPTLALYLGADGTRTLGPRELVLLGTGSPGFNDSGLFGLMHADSLKGLVKLEGEEKKLLDQTVKWLEPKPEPEVQEPPKPAVGTPAPAAKGPNRGQNPNRARN